MALGTEDKMPRGSVDELGNLRPLPGAPAAAQPQPQPVAGPWQRFQPQAQQPATQAAQPATDWSKFVPDQPAAGPWQKQPQTDWSQFVPEQPREMGPISTLAQGFRNTGRAVGAATDVALDDRASVVERANAQASAPKNENLRAFEGEIESRRAALGTDDPGLLDALGVVGGAVLEQPKGAAYAVLEQAPNAVAALAPAWAGAKLGATAGAAIPLPGAAPALGVVGGLAGLFLGNTALEVGHKAMEKATDGQFTATEREAAFQEGGTKAAVITGVDAATLGLSKWIMGATSRAVERATTRALTDAGVDVSNEIAVMAARRSPEIVKAVRQAQEAAIDATATFGKKAARAGAALGLETVGEGLGEYLGELAATGQADMVDAVLESVLSLGQSGAEVAWGASRNAASMAAARLNPAAGPNSRAAIVALNQQAQGKLPPTEGPAAGTMQQAAAAGQMGGNSNNQPSADWAQQIDAQLGTAPAQQEAQPIVPPWLRYEQTEQTTDWSQFTPDANQSTIETFLGTAPTAPAATTSPAAPIDQEQTPRLVPMKDEAAAARRAEVVAKRTGVQHLVIPHPTVSGRFAVVPADSPLATSAAPTAQGEGLDVEGLFQTQSPVPLKNARNLAGMLSMAGGVEHAVVPAPSGDGFGIAPVDQLSPAQRDAWVGFQPGARRGAASRVPGPSAAPTATAVPTPSANTTSPTATPQGMPEAGPELAQVTGATPPVAPAAPAVPEGAQGFNTEAQRAAPALPQIDSSSFTSAIGNAQSTIKRERWTIDGGRRFEGRIRAELERAGVPANAAQAVIDLAKQQTPTDAFVSGDALAQAARTLGVISSASTTATPDISPDTEQIEAAPQQAPRADTQQDKPTTTRAIVPGQTAKGRDVLLAQVEQLKQRTAPADLVKDYNDLKARIADARRRANLKATKRTEAERLTSWADNQDRELERLRTQIGFVELKAGTARYKVLNTPENLEAFAQKLRKARVGRWTVTVQPEEIYDNLETRAGTTEKQRETGRSAVRELARRVTAHLQRRGNHQDRAAIEVLGSRLYDGFAFDGGVDLVGQRVASAEDLATLAQVFRDPRYETFRVFYTDMQGVVVGEAAYSSRLPAAVNLPNDFDAHIRRDMGRFGATGFWVLHNHPSGRATPSPADVNLTKWVASSVNGFRGHVVIDHNEFATIDAGGAVQVVQAPQLHGTDFGSKPELDHHMLGSTINGERDVVQAAKTLQVKNGHAALIFLRRDQKVQLVMDVPMVLLQDTSRAAIGKLRAVVRAFARESGAGGWRFLVLPDGVSPEPMKRLVLDNIFTDIVSADGTTAGNFGAVSTGDFLDYNIPIRRVKDNNNEAPYSLIGTAARTLDELAALAADLPTGTALVVTDGRRIRSVTDVPAALLTDKTKFGRARLRMLARRASREPGQTYLLAPEGTDTKPLRWLVKLEGLRDVVTADATSAAAAIERANRVAEAAPRYSDDFTPERATVKDWIAHQLKQNRGWAMGALTRDQLADIYGDAMPAVEQFDRVVQQMDLVRNRMAEKADALIERWRKLPSAEADRLADVMHAATLAQFDPAEMNATTADEQQIAADFDALSADARQVYRDVRDQYRDTLTNIRDSLAGRAERTGSTGRAIADEIRLRFDGYLSEGPYFSLARFGDFILIADRDGERVVEAFESSLQREKRARGLRAQGFTVKLTAKQQYSATKDGAAGSFIGDVLEKIDALDMDAEQKGTLMDQLNQLAISALPDASYRKHFAHRKGTPGFSNDAMRAFASSQMHAAHHLARIRHADGLALLIDEMGEDIQAQRGDVDTTEQQQVVNELTRRLGLMMNPVTHPVAAALGQVGFVMSLGGSIAAGITNLTQTPMVTYPWLGSKFGFDNAAGALLNASKDYFGGRWDKWSGFVMADNPNLEDDERTALRHLEETGLINLTQASDLAGTANTDSTVSKRAFAINRAMKIVGWTFHTPEVFNRQVSALAAYRLARDAGQAHDTAIESARQALIRTHFDYSASNRARFMSGNVTRVITMFKQYSQNVTYLMWRNAYQALKGESAEVRREARRMLLGVATMHFAAAGTMGLPLGIFGVTPLLALLSMGMGDEDDPWDWETEYRNMLADTFGKEGGEAIAKGPIRMLLNVDLASRVGLGDLWIRPPQKEAEGRDLVEAWMITLLGPVAGYAGQMGTAAKAFEEGKFARGVEAMLPKFLASPLRAIRYEAEGVRSWKGADLGITLTEADIVGTALGFNPARVAEMYEGSAAVKGREARLQARHEELTNMWRESQQAGDRTGVAEAFDQIRQFNQRNPAFGITMKTLRQSAMARRRAQLQTAQGYFLSRRRDELREFGRFANID